MKDGRKKKKDGRHIKGLAATLIGSVLFSLCAAVFLLFQEYRYENGILDVCAIQQDGYVQLVLDQINLKQNRDDEQIITEILATLDASSNKYWTFSKEESMLFVKDVLETNKYKGFTTASFYVSESSSRFLESLQKNKVKHAVITVEDREYIASGVAFEYRGSLYRLCLLTNRGVLLDNNKFLGAKSETYMMVAVLLFLLIVAPCAFAMKLRGLLLKNDRNERTMEELNRSVTALDKLLSQRDLHDTRKNTWEEEALPEFLNKLKERGAFPLVMAKVVCKTPEAKELFLRKAGLTLDRTVLRFTGEGNDVTFLFVQCPHDAAKNALAPLLSADVKCAVVQLVQDSRVPAFQPNADQKEKEVNDGCL